VDANIGDKGGDAGKGASRKPRTGVARRKRKGGKPALSAARAVARAEQAGVPQRRAPLENPRHERFCQLVFSGALPMVAAVRCGYAEGCAHVTASRMLRQADIQGRLAFLWTQSAQRRIARKRDILVAETVDGFSAMADFTPLIGMTGSEAGAFLREHPFGAAVRELEIENIAAAEQDEDGVMVERITSRVKRFKLADARRARDAIARLTGMIGGSEQGSGARAWRIGAPGSAGDAAPLVVLELEQGEGSGERGAETRDQGPETGERGAGSEEGAGMENAGERERLKPVPRAGKVKGRKGRSEPRVFDVGAGAS